MNLNQQAHGRYLDLPSCADYLARREGAGSKWLDAELRGICEDDAHANYVASTRMERFLRSDAYLGQMLPMLGINYLPIKFHREEEKMPSSGQLLLRFFDDSRVVELPSSAQKLNRRRGRSEEQNRRRIRRLQQLIPRVRSDESLLRCFPCESRSHAVGRLRKWIARFVEELIPRAVLGAGTETDPCGTYSGIRLVRQFDAVIQPYINTALPTSFKPYRQLLYNAICTTFECGRVEDACYAFELWARLNPAPIEFLDDICQRIDDALWTVDLNEVQLIRVGLLIADVICNIPTTKTSEVYRNHASRWLVRWSEGEEAHKQLLAKVVLKEICDFDFFPLSLSSFDDPEGIKQVKEQVGRSGDDRHVQLETILQAAAGFERDPWEQTIQRKDCDVPFDVCHNARFQASLLKTIVAYSNNDGTRALALWNIGWFGAFDEEFRDHAYCSYHQSRNIGGSMAWLVREYTRNRNGGFLQDFGPVSAKQGRVMEQAAAAIQEIRRNDKLMSSLITSLSNSAFMHRLTAIDLVEEFLQSQMTTLARATVLARFDCQRSGARRFLRRRLLWWFRRRTAKGEVSSGELDSRICHERDTFQDERALMYELLGQIPADEAAALSSWLNCETRDAAASRLGIPAPTLDYRRSKGVESLRSTLKKHSM